ncbi:RNA-directed DNA polymerase (Reverse transcriptase), Ribonuclease H [Gossypium australe]|uniref:RNA-directed DNA polymerase (Reverse transcriptase), Ribonuclease H n=1 Tax=Gossypium australe TaxID=47621 RepID=A0A5B6WY78_9ROSI|nr:RNA-directed DNA polymerase (Reverse transcriptase), Ribonuclease H [Gossypium australe]
MPGRPLILYLTVFENSMGCVLGQHDESGKRERAIYYLSKKFTEYEAKYLSIEKFEEYEPLRFDFPDEDLMCITEKEYELSKEKSWKMSFDVASNALGHGIGAVLEGNHYPFTARLNFFCTNNVAEYEACVMGLRAAIERDIEILEVYGDSALVIYQIRGDWEVRDLKLVKYCDLVTELIKEFKEVTFNYFHEKKTNWQTP